MFFEMLFTIIISFVLGALAVIVVLAHGVFSGDLRVERTADREARKEKKRERKKAEEEMNNKTSRKKKTE